VGEEHLKVRRNVLLKRDAMRMRTILIGMGVVAIGVVLGGCQSTLCPEGKRLVGEGRARDAVLAYKQCRDGERDSGRIKKINKEIAKLTPGIVQPVVERLNRRPPTTMSQYDQAIADLEDVLPFDEPGKPWRIAEKLTSYKGERQKLETEIRALLGEASEHRQAQRWKEAAASINKAIAKDPEWPDAQDLRRRIISERDDYYAGRIRSMCDAGRWKDALDLLEQFRAEEPQPQASSIQTVETQVEKTKGDMIRRDVTKDIEEKRYFDAYHRIQEAKVTGCTDLLETIKRDAYKHYVSLAKSALNDVRYFHAYAAAVKARELPKPEATSEEDPENIAFELHRQCADLVDDSIRVEVCIAAFDSPQSEAAAGREFADRLVADLLPILPYGLRLDDRRKVEYATVGDREKLRDGLRLVGVSWAVQGSLGISIAKDRQERDKIQWVPVRQTIINPQYETDIETFTKQYGKDSAKWPRQPSRTITVELTKEVTCKVGTERMEGEITVSANIYSAADGAIVQSQSFRIARDVNDTFGDGIDQAGIKADPLEMISQMAFRQQLEQEMRKQVMDWLLRNFAPRQEKFCDLAQYHIDRREWDLAVMAATQGYYYCLRDNVPPDDKWFVKLRQLALFDLTESTPGARNAD
jgi:tetratricopeptide (TPR) repeat protein